MEFDLRSGLQIDQDLREFVENEAIPGSGLDPQAFWEGFAELVRDFEPRRRELLRIRDEMQERIDGWHRERRGQMRDPAEYKRFLEEIGYLVPAGGDFEIETANTDPEIASIAGPQLVVPATNARFALNAANARWNSLYDALYGTDALGDAPSVPGYDPERGARVIAWTKEFLDAAAPLAAGTHAKATKYFVVGAELLVEQADGSRAGLADPGKFAGYRSDPAAPDCILLRNNGLHIEISVNRASPAAAGDMAGIADVVLESAITTIVDCEDSVAAVDAPDKVQAYRNWKGLVDGTLVADFAKSGSAVRRSLEPDRRYLRPDGASEFDLKAQALLLVRNVGLLMDFPAARSSDGKEIGECLLDAVCTVLLASPDAMGRKRNSASGSIYVVVPKLHGPAEVAFVNDMFGKVEDVLGLPRHAVKLGVMDEERRTTLNLKECVRSAKNRVAFINTGFLDRTGDEIHTSMEAGPFLRKADIRAEPWIAAYEDWNVDIGLACGLDGRAQIGKGMWAMPDLMGDMLEQKIAHPSAGANTAWVPSPTAATLHATHYHRVDVAARQAEIKKGGPRARLETILQIPLAAGTNWSEEEVLAEIENNLQGILGYVVRWVDQGVGCSKVPDIRNVALMEDRATCRISSQHLANWLHHGIVEEAEVDDAMRKMAAVVDRQNAADPEYTPMAPAFGGDAYQAAKDLVFKGRGLPSGYTEPVLHKRRLQRKRRC